jgi:glutamate dehydrogenase (NAD(P)+)
MIPKRMEKFLKKQLPERTWQNRLLRENGMCFMEFGPKDIDRLARLGIEADNLGPKMVACIWDEESPLEIGGYLVVDNLAMGRPSMGGIRMLDDLTPQKIHNRARGMTLKSAAAYLPYGGGKAGIISNPDLASDTRTEIIRRFARLLYRYRDIFLPGPDVGTNDADMKTVAIENGLDNALSKPEDMGGSRVSQLGAAGGGVVIGIDALLNELHRLQILPQFIANEYSPNDGVSIILQGFGNVGAHAARIACQRLENARILGISDSCGYLYDEDGLPVETLFNIWKDGKVVTLSYYDKYIANKKSTIKYSNSPDDLLREDAFCFIPAAPIANYLDNEITTNPTMTVDRMGKWSIIVEGANIYSPDPIRKAARLRMEREVYRKQGVLIVTDYLVNSGGVIYAAQEHLIKTPGHLRIPDELLGNGNKVDKWLDEHVIEFATLAEERRHAAEIAREDVIQRNMREFIDFLISDNDILPKTHSAADIMERIITIPNSSTIRDGARLLIETGGSLLAVVSEEDILEGVISEWDITRATADGFVEETTVDRIMTKDVITATPDETILDVVRKLEYNEISALPIVEDNKVIGIVSTDVLARRSLHRLLLTQTV